MISRPRPPEIKKYFLDPPDPAMLDFAETAIQEADRIAAEAQRRWPAPAIREKRQRNRLIVGAVVAFFSLMLWVTGAEFLGFLGFVSAVIVLIRAYVVPRDLEAAEQKAVQEVLSATIRQREHGLAIRQEYEQQYAAAEPKPSDELMDEVLRQDIALIKGRAMKALALHPNDLVRPAYMQMSNHGLDFGASAPSNSNDTRDPFVVYGPAYGAGYAVWSAIGADGKRRYSRYAVMVICATRYHLALYRCVLDFFTGALDEERTTEYHYNDVVAVHSESDPNAGGRIQIQPRPSQRHLFPANTERYFELVVSSGDRARIVTGIGNRRASEINRQANDQNFVHQGSDPDFQAVADAVRMMLREKKGGIQSRPSAD